MPVALAQSVVTAWRAVRAAEDRLRKEERGNRSQCIFCIILHWLWILSSGHFSLVQAQESIQGLRTPCSLGFWGINFEQLPFWALAHPQVRPCRSHWINMAWVPSLDHHCHCLLCKMARRKEYYGFAKLHQELSHACAYWEPPSLPRTSFFSLNIYGHFNTFGFQEECASVISSAALMFVRHLFCRLSNPTYLCLGSGGQPQRGP